MSEEDYGASGGGDEKCVTGGGGCPLVLWMSQRFSASTVRAGADLLNGPAQRAVDFTTSTTRGPSINLSPGPCHVVKLGSCPGSV